MRLVVSGTGNLKVASSGKLHTDDHVESAHRGRDGVLEIALGPYDTRPAMVAHVSGASSVCGGGLAVRDATLHASGSGTVRGFDVRGGCVL